MAAPFSHVEAHQLKLPHHVIDLDTAELRSAAGAHVELRPRSFAVLQLLAENAGRLVNKDEIIGTIWGDVCVTEDSLTQCIADIRRAIGDEERRIVRTVPRVGYMLVPAQRHVESLAATSERPGIAVMPFLSITGDGRLGHGVSVEIINELARNRDLKVIGRDSTFAVGSQPAKSQELGERLGARYLVEGTAQRAEDMLVIDVQLVNARNGVIVWGDRFSAKAAEIPRLQSAIAGRIAASVRVSMREIEKQDALERAPRDLGIYELTLRAASKHRITTEGTLAAREDVEEAIRRDPNYAPALAYLAWINLVDLWNQLTGDWPLSRIDEVVDQFTRAIESAPNLAKAYLGLSQALLTKGDLTQALDVSQRAIELAPSDPDSLLFHAVTLFQTGDLSGATESVERALEYNPLRPSYYSFYHAMILWGAERYQEALDKADDCLRKAPQLCGAEIYKVLALVGLGRIAEARSELARHLARPVPPLMPPHPPELSRRYLADLQTAGWRPSLAAGRKAV